MSGMSHQIVCYSSSSDEEEATDEYKICKFSQLSNEKELTKANFKCG